VKIFFFLASGKRCRRRGILVVSQTREWRRGGGFKHTGGGVKKQMRDAFSRGSFVVYSVLFTSSFVCDKVR
jgi:hypothetical protein